MNLADFAVAHNALDLYLIIDNANAELAQFTKMFKVIDAVRVSTDDVAALVMPDAAENVAFYQMTL